MKGSRWNEIEFGHENYEALISKAGARRLSGSEDAEFVSFVRSLHRGLAAVIDWGSERLSNRVSLDTSGSFVNCDEHLRGLFGKLQISGEGTAWVGWHDQMESVEINVRSAMVHAAELIFVGQGMVAIGSDKRWVVEYAANRWLHGAWLSQK